MQTQLEITKKAMVEDTQLIKKAYKKPDLKTYGLVKQLTQGTGSMNGDGGQTMMVPSDRSIKDNIVQVGIHPTGIGLYLFNYKPEFKARWGFGRQFGVMADEVQTVMPDAVAMFVDGCKRVNYAMLGIDRSVQ